MNKDQEDKDIPKEEPQVFRVAQLPDAGDTTIDRRTFVKSTVTAVGAGAVMGMLSGCEGDEDDHPFVGGEEELPGMEGTVQQGETGINVRSDSGETRTMPCGSDIPAGWTCTCNCVTVPSCTCQGHCTCNRQGSSSGGGHYWYPC